MILKYLIKNYKNTKISLM